MIKIENTQVCGLQAAIRGMRNPKNSWDKSDSQFNAASSGEISICNDIVGPNDLNLMKSLAAGGPVHAKYRRYIDVFVDITAPFYFWKEFKTYRKGKEFVDEEDFYSYDGDKVLDDNIELNSCSTMHKIHSAEITIDDFSTDHLNLDSIELIKKTIDLLNYYREQFLETKEKNFWWQLIQLLPSSYNQKRTVKLNYETLGAMYHYRTGHKLDEWHAVCDWIESLPYSEIITGKAVAK